MEGLLIFVDEQANLPPSNPASPGVSVVDLAVDLAGIRLQNPMMTGSGTSGFGPEYSGVMDLTKLGAFVTKAVSLSPRKGNPPERVVETPSGMLNAIGLANVGLDRFIQEKVPFLQTLGIPIIVNVVGHRVEEYRDICAALDEIDCIAGLELNVSCPNVANGLEFGADPRRLHDLVSSVRAVVRRAKLIVKLSPNVTDIAETALSAIDAGAEILSLINTLSGMVIHVETRKPMLANRSGGLSGPAIRPVAVFMVHRVYTKAARDRGVPIIGMGGIATWRDAVEFLLAGASALAVGTALFVDPRTPLTICEGLRHYIERTGASSVRALVGALR